MSRDRLVRLALRAYPASVRAERGAEIADTLVDAAQGAGSARFVRELATLACHGLGARARLGAGDGAARVFADGACLAGWLMAALILGAYLTDLRFLHLFAAQFVVIVAVVALGAAGRDRLAGVGMAAWILWGVVATRHQVHWVTDGVALLVVLSMVAAPRRRPRPHRELLIALVALAGLIDSPAVFVGTLVALTLVGLSLIGRDARLAIACSLVWLTGGLTLASTGYPNPALTAALLSAASTVLVACAIRSRFVAA